MVEKVTIMKLKVDLQCRKCYMEVKKVLSKYPQIRDQLYDEKNDTVTIRVVCCSPERVRDNLCCQGGGSIKSIEIVEPPKPKPPHEKPIIVEPGNPNEPGNNKPKLPSGTPKLPKHDPVPPPPPAATKFPEPPQLSVFASPSPAVPVELLHGGGPSEPTGFYGRPIYNSYGWSGPCYVGHHRQCLCEEEASVCTIA